MTTEARVESLRRAIRAFLEDLELKFDEGGGSFRLLFGTPDEVTCVWVFPQAWGETATIAQVMSVVVRDVRIDPDLEVFLCDQSSQMLFGKLTLEREKGEVRYESPLLGDFLNKDELKYAIAVAAASADKLHNLIIERWGGRRPVHKT
jgi:hypothetical protein